MTLTTRVTPRTDIGRLTIGRIMRKKTWRSFAPSTRADSVTSAGMLFTAAERVTVAKPTDPQIPTAVSAHLTRCSAPRHENGDTAQLARNAVRRPMLASGQYAHFHMLGDPVAAVAMG